MKKLVPAAAVLAILAFLPPLSQAGLSARFSLGAGFVRSGDLAAGIRGYNDFSLSLYGSDLKGRFSAPGLGFEPSAEIVFSPGPRWGIGLGFGYSFFSRSSEMSYAIADATVAENLTAGVYAIPFELNLHFFFPLSERVTIDAWAGPGISLVRMKWDYRMTVGLEGQSGTDHFEFKAERPAFGGQAGIGIAFKLSEAFDLTAEIRGRLSAAAGFTGNWTETGSGDFWAIDDSGETKVWAFDLLYGGKTYRQLSFQESKPAGANINSAEEAKIGLSGVSVRIGFRVRLPSSRRDRRG